MCVRVCVRETDRDNDRERQTEREWCVCARMCACVCIMKWAYPCLCKHSGLLRDVVQ